MIYSHNAMGSWVWQKFSPTKYLCYNIIMVFSILFQQIRASDIWRESQHEDLQHWLLDYHLKITMKGTEFDPPMIKFKASTDDSQLDIHLWIDYEGMKEFVQICTCRRRQASCTTILFLLPHHKSKIECWCILFIPLHTWAIPWNIPFLWIVRGGKANVTSFTPCSVG